MVALVRQVLVDASLQPEDVDVICYTRGPGMGGPLRSCAVCARTLAQVREREREMRDRQRDRRRTEKARKEREGREENVWLFQPHASLRPFPSRVSHLPLSPT